MSNIVYQNPTQYLLITMVNNYIMQCNYICLLLITWSISCSYIHNRSFLHELIYKKLKDKREYKRGGKPPKIWTPTLAYPNCYFSTNTKPNSIGKYMGN